MKFVSCVSKISLLIEQPPETLCEGRYCEDAEDEFADEHNIKLKD